MPSPRCPHFGPAPYDESVMDQCAGAPRSTRARELLVVALCSVAIAGVWLRRNDLALTVIVASAIVFGAIPRLASQIRARGRNV